MKLILSRKGLDASFGAMPSPILPDGRLCWIPIPEDSTKKPSLPTYDDVSFSGGPLGDIVSALSKGKLRGDQRAHVDPDLNPEHLPRVSGWRPVFGQAGAAERHLLNSGVESGDLFLFFGWFRQTEVRDGRLRFVRDTPDLHVIYGWLQVAERLDLNLLRDPPQWMKRHPHVQGDRYGSLDSLYLSTKTLSGFGRAVPTRGAGIFREVRDRLVLSAPGHSRSIWRLPEDFYPARRQPLSFHTSQSRWSQGDGYTLLRTAGRGQEFVLDLDQYPGVSRWVAEQFVGAGPATNERRDEKATGFDDGRCHVGVTHDGSGGGPSR